MSELERFPIDYDALQKGDVIQVDRIEKITRKPRGSQAYQFELLKLVTRIDKELNDRGKFWTLCTEGGAIKVLTDVEAVSYNHAQQVKARAAQLRRFALQQAIDVTQLDAEAARVHGRNLENDGKYIQSLLSTRKEIALKSNVRTVPGLPA